jgi:N-methylhydantoinase A
MGYRIGIDTGGTFVDVVAIEDGTGRTEVIKSPSVPEAPAQGTLGALDRWTSGRENGDHIESVFHGTTIATNAVLEGTFAVDQMGLVVTGGCRDLLEIARQTVPGAFGNMVIWIKPDRPVPRQNVREVAERLDPEGGVVTALEEEGVREIARDFSRRGINQIAVSLLHSYVNPAHERRVRELIAEEYPEAYISLSSDVLPEFREYERTLTTVLDVALRPIMVDYITTLEAGLEKADQRVPLSLMKLNAGLATPEEVKRAPVYTVLSGPAAGALAGAYLADVTEHIGDLITLDMGGTSTDICLVEGGTPLITTDGRVGIYPIKVPMVDVVTIGAGGGSVAWLGAGKSLQVGPRSAGANPGPACYGRGGDEPTITDAQLFLGRLPAELAGGEVGLDRQLAQSSVESLAKGLGIEPVQAAHGIVAIAIQNMAGGIRRVSVQRGRDPGDYYLAAFGGAGPLHAAEMAELMGMKGAVIPAHPGTVSALGLLVTDVKTDHVRTFVRRQDRVELAVVNQIYSELEGDALAKLEQEGVPADRRAVVRWADVRYVAQGYEVRVPVPSGELGEPELEVVIDAFHETHERTYDYSDRQDLAELVNLRVEGIGREDRPPIEQIAAGSKEPPADSRIGEREVYFAEKRLECSIYDRDHLVANNVITGPAIIEQYDSTTVVPPGFKVTVDVYANLIIEVQR